MLYYMNIIICENKKLLSVITPFIDINQFIMVSSQINAKILMKNCKVNCLIYEKTSSIDIEFFTLHIKSVLSFDEFINATNIKKEKKIEKKEKKEKFVSNSNLNKQEKLISNDKLNKKIGKVINNIGFAANNSINKNNPSSANTLLNKRYHLSKTCRVKKTPSLNDIFIFTSVKGGVGVSSFLASLCKVKKKKLLVDLAFVNGGSDLSYYLDLPQVPHMANYIMDAPESLAEHTIDLNEYTRILQAPAIDKFYNQIIEKDIFNIIKYCNSPILIDLPRTSKFFSILVPIATKIFIITTATPMEVNRIQSSFTDYNEKVISIISNTTKNKNYDIYFNELNLPYMSANQLIKEFNK